MHYVGLTITAIMMLLMVALWAPGVMAANRGKMLRNIAIWLAIFAALGLFYKAFGPGSPKPLFTHTPPPATLYGKPAQTDGKSDGGFVASHGK